MHIENPHLLRAIQLARPGARLPSQKQLADDSKGGLLQDCYQKMKTEVDKQLSSNTQYVTTLSFFPHYNLGGNITLTMEDSIIAPQVLKMKMYNVMYHLLRASNPFPLPAPNNTRQAARRFEQFTSLLHVLTTNQERVGGIRVELRVRHTHLEDSRAMHGLAC